MNIFHKFLDKILGSNTLYYPWCLTKTLLPNIQNSYEQILRKAKIDFITLKDIEYCCGSPILRAWLRKWFEEIKQKNIEIFKKHAVKKIITNCPACYNMLRDEYKLKDYWIEVEHITQTLINKKILKKELVNNEEITYHDPCHLWRLSWVYDEPRNLIEKYWYKIVEFKENREKSNCCGWWWWLVNNNGELSKKIIQNLIKEVKTKKLTSPCPMCYYQFKNNSKDVEVVELSDLIL